MGVSEFIDIQLWAPWCASVRLCDAVRASIRRQFEGYNGRAMRTFRREHRLLVARKQLHSHSQARNIC